MAGLTLPTTLGAATIPQTPYIRRAATINTNIGDQAALEAQNIREQGQDKIPPALNNVGDSFDKLQLQADQKEAKDNINSLSAENRVLLYGDGTPQNPGFYSLQGDNAVKAAPGVKAQIEKNRQKYAGLAKNKQSGAMYDTASQAMIQPDLDGVLKHGADQFQVSLDATDKATVDTGTNMLVANPTDSQNIANALTMITQSTTSYLDRKGITDPTARQDALKNATSNALQAAVRTQLLKDPASGEALYAKFKNGIVGTDQAAVEQDIKQAKAYQLAQADHAMALADRNKRLYQDDQQNKLFAAFVGGSLTPDMIRDSGVDPDKKPGFLGMLETRDKSGENFPVNQPLFVGLWDQIDKGIITDRSQFATLFGPNKLNTTMIGHLDEEFSKVNKPGNDMDKDLADQWKKAARDQLTKANDFTGIKDSKGEIQMGKALSWYAENYAKDIKTMSKREMFDPDNPKSLYNGIGQFKRNQQDIIRDLLADNPGNPDVVNAAEAPQEIDETQYNSLDEVKQAFKDKKINAATAKKISIDKGWAQ